MHVTVDGRELTLSNLDKQLYPAAGFRKADVIDYYRRIAPAMLPHLAGRPPTLVRAPDGAAGERFFEKRCPPHHPGWVKASEPLEPNGGQRSCVVDDLPTLVWLANLAALELHTNQWRLPDVDTPRAVVLDLDPGPPADIVDCCRVALDLREVLDALGLVAVVKTSGGKGLHISVPLNGTETDAPITDDHTKTFALALGQLLESRDKKRVTVNMAKAERHGQRVRRLEPERPAQDDDLRVLAAHRGTTDGIDAGYVGRGARRRSTATTPTASRSRRRSCSNVSPTVTTTTRRHSRCTRCSPS